MAIATGTNLKEQVVHLKVPWAAYETLASYVDEDSHTLLAYDGETLELMSPHTDHEAYKSLIEVLLGFLVAEWGVNLYATGSTTLQAEPRGAEPDASYYSKNAAKIKGLAKIDLRTNPPPDLVVEIDLSHSRLDKLELYAALRVPEFWRLDRESLVAFALVDGSYEAIETSIVIDGLPIAEPARFLERRLELDRPPLYHRSTGF
jgi:Uma2 family endonuclease